MIKEMREIDYMAAWATTTDATTEITAIERPLLLESSKRKRSYPYCLSKHAIKFIP